MTFLTPIDSPFGKVIEDEAFRNAKDITPMHENKLVMPTDMGTGERMMKWLSWRHLPPELQNIVQLYQELGMSICANIPAGPERTVALRKLVESKDCAVRAIIEGKETK